MGDIAIVRNGFASGATMDIISVVTMEKTSASSSAMQRAENDVVRAEDEKNGNSC